MVNVCWDVNQYELHRFGELAEALGWDVKISWDGVFLSKEIEEVSENVTMAVGCEDIDQKIPLDEILAASAKSFHSVAAACEMALSSEGDNSVYLYGELEAVERLMRYLRIAVGMKEDMVNLILKVREAQIDLYSI